MGACNDQVNGSRDALWSAAVVTHNHMGMAVNPSC